MAYGINGPFGLQAWGTILGYTPSGKVGPYAIPSGYATSIFEGDRVALSGGYIVPAAAGTPAIGVFQAVQYVDSFGNYQSLPYWAASTTTYNTQPSLVLVNDDYATLFNVQVSNSGSTTTLSNYAITQEMIGLNADLAIGGGGAFPQPGPTALNPTSGSTVTGQSGYYLDFSTLGTGSNLDVTIVGFTPIPGNVSGLPFNNVLVTLNNDTYRGTGVGITNFFGITSVATGVASYTVLPGDETIDVTTHAGGTAIVLPTAGPTNVGKVYIIKDASGNSGTNNITISVTGGGNIDGANTLLINANYGKATVFSNGTQWFTR
jgi:hypothetical protein